MSSGDVEPVPCCMNAILAMVWLFVNNRTVMGHAMHFLFCVLLSINNSLFLFLLLQHTGCIIVNCFFIFLFPLTASLFFIFLATCIGHEDNRWQYWDTNMWHHQDTRRHCPGYQQVLSQHQATLSFLWSLACLHR